MATNTPFFQAFGALLFGRNPRKLIGKVKALGSLGELYALFGDMLPDHLLARSDSGPNSREWTLTPKVTFWAFVSQVFDVGSACRDVVRKVEAWWRWLQKDSAEGKPPLSPSAYCQARARLDMQTLRLIHGHLAWSLERRVQSAQLWLGRRVKIVDGTTLSMPDTDANQQCWPQPSSQKEGLGIPCMKLVGIFSLASGSLEDDATGTLHQHESILFRSLWERLEKGDLMLGDRGFCSYGAMAWLFHRGIDSVMRLHQARKASFREGRRLGQDDRLITWQKPAQRTEAWSLEEWEALPAELSLRLIRLPVSTPGFRTRSVTLVTTLTDAGAYPADMIRALDGQRWQVELHFHQIKILLGLDILRCKSPELIEKETLMHIIAYNMVRLFMQKAAGAHEVDLSRISFKGTLDTVRHFANVIQAAHATPRRQDALIEQMLATIAGDPVPERPGRSEPRAKKRRSKNYHLRTKPRSEMRVPPHRNRPRPLIPNGH
ncbi:MAG: IS4 family transposase [Chthoniobacteraceae bacterium]